MFETGAADFGRASSAKTFVAARQARIPHAAIKLRTTPYPIVQARLCAFSRIAGSMNAG